MNGVQIWRHHGRGRRDRGERARFSTGGKARFALTLASSSPAMEYCIDLPPSRCRPPRPRYDYTSMALLSVCKALVDRRLSAANELATGRLRGGGGPAATPGPSAAVPAQPAPRAVDDDVPPKFAGDRVVARHIHPRLRGCRRTRAGGAAR